MMRTVWTVGVLLVSAHAMAQVTGRQVDLREAVELAAHHNRAVRRSTAEVETAAAKVRTAWALLQPVARAKLEYTHMDHSDTVDLVEPMAPLLDGLGIPAAALPPTDPLLANPQDKLVGSVEVLVPLVHPEHWFTVAAARSGQRAAALGSEAARLRIEAAVAKTYLLAVTARHLVELHQGQVETARAQLETARAKAAAGSSVELDVVRAQTDVARAQQDLVQAEAAYADACDALGDLIGLDGPAVPRDSVSLEDVSMEPEGEVRPDIAARQQALDAAHNQLRAVRMRFVPTLDAAFFGTYQFTELPDLGSDDPSRWGFMLTLTVPLYDGYRYGALREQRAAMRRAELDAQDASSSASVEERKALRAYQTAQKRLAVARQQRDLAQRALDIAQVAYRNGAATSLDVSTAQQAARSAGINVRASELALQVAAVDLLAARGISVRTALAAR